ncbi:MAG: hypothetical protein P1U85_06390 [Verrucomicrobiales bacterium]|nr:hypothetical protein [Verrucomicrobiales bacterium]
MRIPFVGPIVVVGLLQLLTWGGGFLIMAMMIKAYERAGGTPGEVALGRFSRMGISLPESRWPGFSGLLGISKSTRRRIDP